MLRRSQPDASRGRGQALVEFALVLPILALLIVIAIDFGRVFFGWVSLTNAARIGANYVGYTPNLLDNPTQRDEYETLIADAITGCTPSPTDFNNAAYDPVFDDVDGDGDDNGWGDHAIVTIRCDFDMITPVAGVLFGNKVTMAAEAVFPIRSGGFAGPGGGGTPPTGPCTQSLIPDLVNRTLQGAQDKWLQEHFDPAKLTFAPAGAASDWLVLGGGSGPVFSPSAVINQCVDPSVQSVHLTLTAPPPCPSTQAQVPDLRGLEVSEARIVWEDAGFDPAKFKPTNADNTKTVLTQVTNPVTSPVIGGCVAITAEVTITFGEEPPDPCEVPIMIGMTYSQALAAWRAGTPPFTGPLNFQGPSGGTVHQQTPIHPGRVSCAVTGEVRLRN